MKKSVLIVDDEADILAVLSEALSSLDLEIVCAENGNRALHLLQSRSFDLVVSDYNMPQLDGLELLKILKEKGSKVPVIWISGRADQNIFREAWYWGVFDYFSKPFQLETLKEAVSAALLFGNQPSDDRARAVSIQGPLKTFSVLIPDQILKEVDAFAEEAGLSSSTVVQRAILDLLSREKHDVLPKFKNQA